ncbi:MAG TPA: hypothetical protein EYP98_09205, partial [Planctomycetes bacterium]|nr:hypothetical protein [Planctomycetota bacterium]
MIRSTLLSLTAAALLTSTAAAQFFTPGNLVVLRVGDPTITLGSHAAPLFLDEWNTTTNTLVQSLQIPNSSTNAAPSVTQRGFSSSEGCLTMSADGRYLVLVGYDRTLGATDPSSEPAISNQRVLVVLEDNSQAEIIEHYVSSDAQQNGFVNCLIEFVVGNNARVQHYRINLEQEDLLHVGGVHVDLHRSAHFYGFTIAQ